MRVSVLTRVLALMSLAVAIGGIWIPVERIGFTDYTAFTMSVPWATLMTGPAIVLGLGFVVVPDHRLRRVDPRIVRAASWTLAGATVVGVAGVKTYPSTDAFFEKFLEGVVIPAVGEPTAPHHNHPYVLAALVVVTALSHQWPAISRTASDASTIAEPSGAPGPG